jgi:hypothetical protein
VTDAPLGEFRPPPLTTIVRLKVPDSEPIEMEIDIDTADFKKAMDEQAPNGLVIAEDREGKRWFGAYQSIHSVDAKG